MITLCKYPKYILQISKQFHQNQSKHFINIFLFNIRIYVYSNRKKKST